MSTLPHPSALLGCIHTCCGPGLTEGIHRAYQPRRCINVGHFRLQVSTLVLGSQDEDYPFACPPGTVGGTDKMVETQLSHVCSGACPAGSMCHSATQTPQRTPPQVSNLETSRKPQRRSALLTRSCLPARHSLYGWLLLSARFGRGHILPAGKYQCQYEPHVGGGVRHMPCGTLLRGWLADQLRKVDLQPAGGSGYADGVQVVPPKLCDQGNRRLFGS